MSGRAAGRWTAGLGLEWRVELRHGVPAAAAVLAALWSAVLAAVPASWAPSAAVVLLVVDTAGFGVLFAAVLVLYERGQGGRAALAVTPQRPHEYVGARVAVLTALAVAVAVPVALAASRERLAGAVAAATAQDAEPAAAAIAASPAAVSAQVLAPVLLGVALLSVLLVGLALAASAGAAGLGALFVRAPLLAPLVLAPVAHVAGAVDHPLLAPLLYAVPTTGGADLIRAGLVPQAATGAAPTVAAALYLLVCAVGAVALACRACGADVAEGPLRPSRSRRALRGRARCDGDAGTAVVGGPPRSRSRRLGAVAGAARIDLRGLRRDPLLLVMLLGPAVLALGLRWGYPPVQRLLADRPGLDLEPFGPVLLAALVVLHVPLMLGAIGALRTLEEADDGTLLVLRASPLTPARYLGYRLTAVAAATGVGLAVAVPVSGLGAPGGAHAAALVPAVVLAAVQAPLLVLAATAFAASRVEALVVVKAAGAVLTLLPAAVWWLPEWARWALAPLPPFWPVAVLPGYSVVPWAPGLAAGLAVTAAAGAWLARRTQIRLDSGG